MSADGSPAPRALAYVVGKVTGIGGLNREAFEGARATLEGAGMRVRIPHDFIPPSATHARAMRLSLSWLLAHAELVVALPGWESSEGATLEVAVARAVGIPVAGYADLALAIGAAPDGSGC